MASQPVAGSVLKVHMEENGESSTAPSSSVGIIVGGSVAALAVVGATVVALTYACRTTGPQHMRVRAEPDPRDGTEMHEMAIVHRAMIDEEPPVVIAEALPLATATVVRSNDDNFAASSGALLPLRLEQDERDPFPVLQRSSLSDNMGKEQHI